MTEELPRERLTRYLIQRDKLKQQNRDVGPIEKQIDDLQWHIAVIGNTWDAESND